MPTAVTETIAAEVVSRLGQITTGNGYALTVADVTRVNRDATDWTPVHLGIVVVQGDEERNADHDYPGNPPAMAYELPFLIRGFVRQADRTTTADQASVNALQAAIKKAIANTSDWVQFDSSSYDADWGSTTNFNSTEHAGTAMELRVRYRISELDPYTVR